MTPKYAVNKVAVLGAGVMGVQIAAHCVNAGLDVVLLDLKNDDASNPDKAADEALQKASKMKPAPFGLPEFAGRIRTGNFEDDFDLLKDADWICEVIIEKMDIKKNMMARIDEIRAAHTIVSSNTSGLPISDISAECSDAFRAHFLGTHFFNPPRYMKLLEIIPTDDTAPEVHSYMRSFCEQMLGKGVVDCKDTPNFIANRIGIFSIACMMPWFFEGKLRAEEIDHLTGTLTGYSKAATFRTADMAGLDVTLHVSDNLHPAIPDDERQEVFNLPNDFRNMVEAGHTGNKAGKGFYKKTRTDKGTEYQVIKAGTLEYESQQSTGNEFTEKALKIRNTADRLRFLCFEEPEDETSQIIWEMQKALLLYAANRLPEISDDPLAVDRAMKWGFNWEMGPFERWDALGIEQVAERLRDEGESIPRLIQDMLSDGLTSFYKDDQVLDPISCEYVNQKPAADGEININDLPVVRKNDSARIRDLGDGVALFEFTTRNYTLGFELVQTLEKELEDLQSDFDAMVISHSGDNFAFGANLKEALVASEAGDREKVVAAVTNFQRTAVKLRYTPIPVVSAPFGRTLGGGTEFCLYADRVVAHHELYMGLVEVGVGLIPAGGGTTELLSRAMNQVTGDADPLPFIREVFKTIGMAKVSESAHLAGKLGFLSETDRIVMNRDLVLKRAKAEALGLVQAGYQPPAEQPVKVLGRKALAAMKLMLHVMHEGKYITDYDKVVAERVAFVLAGGDLSEPQEVPESWLLKLEREAILECLNDDRTLARMEHMLKKGRPLRN